MSAKRCQICMKISSDYQIRKIHVSRPNGVIDPHRPVRAKNKGPNRAIYAHYNCYPKYQLPIPPSELKTK